jgi:hypothetical protein
MATAAFLSKKSRGCRGRKNVWIRLDVFLLTYAAATIEIIRTLAKQPVTYGEEAIPKRPWLILLSI